MPRRGHAASRGRPGEEPAELVAVQPKRSRFVVHLRPADVASLYKYCEQEQLVDRNPALIHRPNNSRWARHE